VKRRFALVALLALPRAAAAQEGAAEETLPKPTLAPEPEAIDDAPSALPIDEKTVVALALVDHPHVLAAQADRAAADAGFSGARYARVPDVQFVGRYTRLSSIPAKYRTFGVATFPQILDNVGVRAQLYLPLSDAFLSLAASARALGHGAEAAKLEEVNARARVAYEARVAFLNYWRGTLALATAVELVHAAQRQVDDQRAREAVGTVAKNDVLTFEVALDAALMSEQSARSTLASADAQLRAFLPSAGDRPLRVPELAETPGELPPPPPPVVATPPRIAALDAQAGAAGERAKSASLDRLPKLSLFAAGDYAAPSPRVFVLSKLTFIPTWEVGARVEWSLSQATIGTAVAKREKALHDALKARADEARRKLEADRASALKTFEYAHARAQRAARRVEHAATLAKARRGELQAGTALPLNVVLAETDLAHAKNDYVDAVVERALSLAQLDFADGRVEPSLVSSGGAP
jgi:outer membrane protein TolC